jgi:hypothetical protein
MGSWKPLWTIVALLLGVLPAWAQTTKPKAQPESVPFRVIESPYYKIKNDLPDDRMREVYIRMTRMYEEYQQRTAGFSGQNRGMLNFELYTKAEDYYAAGGMPGSAGVFMSGGFGGSRLMAIAGGRNTEWTWHVIQHEGFHQFASAVIRGNLPPWVNEGLAEYFGEAIFTGDSYVAGVIPNQRLKELQGMISKDASKPLYAMLTMTHMEWNDALDRKNYTQAWSMIHFLAHGDDGKYQKALVQFMNNLSAGAKPQTAWTNVFGNDTLAFEKKWKEYWTGLKPNSTQNLYDEAAHRVLTSVLARVTLNGQKFETAEDFLKACEAKKIEIPLTAQNWLPVALLDEHVPVARKSGQWEIIPADKGKPLQLKRTTKDDKVFISSYLTNGTSVTKVNYLLQPAPTSQPTGTTPSTTTTKTTVTPTTRPTRPPGIY